MTIELFKEYAINVSGPAGIVEQWRVRVLEKREGYYLCRNSLTLEPTLVLDSDFVVPTQDINVSAMSP